jgi:large subunit ribosomal protein L22
MSQRKKQRKQRLAEQRAERKHKSARLFFLRVTPRKARAVADVIRGLPVDRALAVLEFTRRSAAPAMARMLKAVVANASTLENVDVDQLYVKEIHVDQGPMLKRFLPRSRGQATSIHKKTCHIHLLLGERGSKG